MIACWVIVTVEGTVQIKWVTHPFVTSFYSKLLGRGWMFMPTKAGVFSSVSFVGIIDATTMISVEEVYQWWASRVEPKYNSSPNCKVKLSHINSIKPWSLCCSFQFIDTNVFLFWSFIKPHLCDACHICCCFLFDKCWSINKGKKW